MSKKLTKISLVILTFVFAFCMSVAMLGIGNAYATDGAATFTMVDGASVRIDGNNGIRFAAIVTDYDPDYEYGMILAPTDWLVDDEGKTLNTLSFADMQEYDSTKTYGDNDVYFARGTNIPSTTSVITGNQVDNGYELTCSFVNIKTSNLSRTFTARAYYAPIVEGEADYTQATLTDNVAVANIYTVISTYMVSDSFEALKEESVESESEQLKNVVEYVEGAVGAVTAVYTDTDITVTGLTDGVAYRGGDALTVKATVSKADGSRTIDSGVKVEIKRTTEASVDETLTYNEKTGEIALETSGVFNIKATVGETVVDTAATIKRDDVSVTMQDVSWDVSSLSKLNSGQYYYPISTFGKATDPEKETTGIKYTIRKTGSEWLYIDGSISSNYLLFNPHTKMDGEMFVVASYVDDYGVTYSAEGQVEQKDITANISFDDTKTKVNADVLTLTRDKTAGALCIENVPLTGIENNLIRFANDKTVYTTQTIYVKFVDHDNPNNYVNLYMDSVNGSANSSTGVFQMRYAISTPIWTGNWTNSGQMTGMNLSSKVWSDSRPCCSLRSGLTENQNHHLLDTDYYRGMLGVTITDNLYINYFASCTATSITQKAVCSAENQTTNGLTAWSGLGDATAVDIYIYGTVRSGGNGSILYVDTLGGGSISGLSQDGTSVIIEHANGSPTEHAIYYAVDCTK